MTFRVGQKVVCVDDGPSKFTGRPTTVKKGSIYTVTQVWLHQHIHPCVLLAEIEPLPGHYGFDACRFRPIVERMTDISFAHEILRKATKPARTPAMSLHQGNCE